jgi:WD40 repeat protein
MHFIDYPSCGIDGLPLCYEKTKPTNVLRTSCRSLLIGLIGAAHLGSFQNVGYTQPANPGESQSLNAHVTPNNLENDLPSLRLAFGDPSEVTSASVSESGTFVWLGTRAGEISMWRVGDGGSPRRIWAIPPTQPLDQRALSNPNQTPLRLRQGAFLFVTPDEASIITAAWANNLSNPIAELRDARTGALVRRFKSYRSTDGITAFALSPDNQLLALGKTHHGADVVDLHTGEFRKFVAGSTNTSALCFSNDGTEIVIADDSTTRAYKLNIEGKSATFERDYSNGLPSAMACDSRHNRIVLADSQGHLQQWEIDSDASSTDFHYERDDVTSAAYINGGNSIVVGHSDGQVLIIDANTAKVSRQLYSHDAAVTVIAASSNGRYVLTADKDGKVRISDLQLNNQVLIVRPPTIPIERVVFANSGSALISAADAPSGLLFQEWGGRNHDLSNFETTAVTALDLSPDGAIAAIGDNSGAIYLWDTREGRSTAQYSSPHDGISSISVSKFFDRVLTGSDNGMVSLWSPGNLTPSYSWQGRPNAPTALSSDGRRVAFMSDRWDENKSSLIRLPGYTMLLPATPGPLQLWNAGSPDELQTVDSQVPLDQITFSPDGRTLAATDNLTKSYWIFDLDGELGSSAGTISRTNINRVAFSPDGTKLLVAASQQALMVDVADDNGITMKGDAPNRTLGAALADDMVALSGHDGTIHLWRQTGEQAATIGQICDSTDDRLARGRPVCAQRHWIVTAPNGLYDSDSPGDLPGVAWVSPAAPMTPLPIEAFIREYFEPGLLAKVLKHETLRDVKAIETRSRIQPTVEILSINAREGEAKVSVSFRVHVDDQSGSGRDIQEDSISQQVRDLRLFRDGQLVGYRPTEGGAIKLTNGAATLEIPNIEVPTNRPGQKLLFSAYAFNADGIKSPTAKLAYTMPDSLPKRTPRAYLIAIGIDSYENDAWRLHYAADDASEMLRVIIPRIKHQYPAPIQVALLARRQGERFGTKAQIKAVFELLAGHHVGADVMAEIQNSIEIQKAHPEDLIIISYSGHGISDRAGQFYIFPSDIGSSAANERIIDERLYSHLISADDLAMWLRDIDAGEMILIVDACQSAASIKAPGFLPAPLDSRGLGQIAYDKGMRVLAASQAEEVAFESKRLRHGLLNYALLREGLEAGAADVDPKNQNITARKWLAYGARRVPEIYSELISGRLNSNSIIAHEVRVKGNKLRASPQQPQLFDFRRLADDISFSTK